MSGGAGHRHTPPRMVAESRDAKRAEPLVPGVPPREPTATSGRLPLAGTTFAVKDTIDLKGAVTGMGNPAWARTHAAPRRDAECVRRLLAAGSRLVGKAVCAEFAWSLSGDNVHYGMPLNALAPDRDPGGSSSGPAAAVAAGICDIGLGTDTLGSVRVPASYCGLWGFRPSAGTVPMDGVMPLAQRFDTVGVLTRDLDTATRAMAVLEAGAWDERASLTRVVVASDALGLVDEATRGHLERAVAGIAASFDDVREQPLFEDPGAYAEAMRAFSVIQSRQVWRNYGRWVTEVRPALGPGVAERFRRAAAIDDDDVRAAETRADALVRRVVDTLDARTALVLPAAGPAPRRSASAREIDVARAAAGRFCAVASIAGLPEIVAPIAGVDGAPLGIGLVARHGADAALLRAARPLAAEPGGAPGP